MCKKLLFCGLMAGLVLALVPRLASAGVMQLDFNVDGQLPNAENTNLSRVTNSKGMSDAVAGGLWKSVDTDPGEDGGYLYYAGDNPSIATSDVNAPMSINTRIRLLADQGANSNLLLNFRSAAGFLWMYFEYDANTGASKIGGRHRNGSIFLRDFPVGKTLGDFHDLAVTWDPTSGDSQPAELWVDGVNIGSTYAGIDPGWSNLNGNVEFGDETTASPEPAWEMDSLRFGNDQFVVPEPASMLLLLGGASLFKLRRCRN
jgi:hypothetical protein